MVKIKPFKVDFIDPVDMCVVEDTNNIVIWLDAENVIHAELISESPEFDKELIIRVKE